MTDDERDTYERIACRECGTMLKYISESHLRSEACTGRFEYPSDYKEHHGAPLFAPATKEKL
ncbi:hypothetical protein [Halogranum rubrum]|uniref:Uncharacterized protein n=1 Tax=Halogranum salarium B-1 TaxID=1210908 RepID=J3JGW6_9EURY|nr:hypothetical protein [Halogranum salarium]EJN60456.1 hypothetical protein HSB1_10590 [Halogranum salarium B-1]